MQRPELRKKVLVELEKGLSPIDIARRLHLSLLAVAAIIEDIVETTMGAPKKPTWTR